MVHMSEPLTWCCRSKVRYWRELHGFHGVEHQYLVQVVQCQVSVWKEVLKGAISTHSRGGTRTFTPQGGYSTACPIKLEKVG